MLNEFKEFAVRGNVIDMAVGLIIGAAFGTIVQSLVNDILYINRLKRPSATPEPTAPYIKKCPYRISDVPVQASRCPNCTSEISAAAAAS